jgi:nitrate reductase molybdenum cofactor assembly chaperone NarJ/NarW
MNGNYEILAALLEYPQAHSALCFETANTADADDLREFALGIEPLTLSEVQELYTRTFDLNPACALEVGYHLFGENYKRGEFLAHLREIEAPFDLGQENQLPDYLPVLLRLLSNLDDDLRSSLISECLVPAVEKMLTTFKDATNPYRSLLEVVRKRLQTEPGAQRTETLPTSFHMRASLPVVNASFMEAKPELF